MKRDDLLDLNDVLQHPGRRVEVDVSTDLEQESDLDLVAPLEGFLDCVSTGNVLLIEGEFKARAVLECARCAGPLETDVSFQLEEQFAVEGVPSSLSQTDTARVVADEPFPLFEGNQLMVENLLRQGLLLSMPDQPLCEFGWDGDCPRAKGLGVGDGPMEGRPEFSRLATLVPTDIEDGEDDDGASA